MPAQSGNEMLLMLDQHANGNFTAVAGIRTRTFTLGANTIDITHSGSAGRWRELLAHTATRRASINGSGVFVDEASDEKIRALFMSGNSAAWQLVLPHFGTLTGTFHITSLAYSGQHDAEVTFSIQLESSGQISFAPSN